MIYGPYMHRRKFKSKKVARIVRYNYNARPGKCIVMLRIAFALCLTALAAMGGRLLYLDRAAKMAQVAYCPSVPELAVTAALVCATLLLLCLIEQSGSRRKRG